MESSVMASAWGLSFGSAWGNAWGAINTVQPVLASLGGTPYEQKKQRISAIDDEVEEPLSAETVSRIRNEFLSEALANDLINRAKVRKARAEEEALLLMI